jgi:hypothetical protein
MIAAALIGLLLVPGSALAASAEFSSRIGRTGSTTLPTRYAVWPESAGRIEVELIDNPRDLRITAVSCGADHRGGPPVGPEVLIEANDHTRLPIAESLPEGTCFQIRIGADTFDYFDVRGMVHS